MLSQSQLTAKVYYHGTNLQYLNQQLKQHGKYLHDESFHFPYPVCITAHKNEAVDYALDRSKVLFPNMTPLLLVISGDEIRQRTYEYTFVNAASPHPCIDFLLINEFKQELIG